MSCMNTASCLASANRSASTLEALERAEPLLLLGLVSHADPDVSVDDVGTADGLTGVLDPLQLGLAHRRPPQGLFPHQVGHAVAARRRYRKVGPRGRAGQGQTRRDVVPVADERNVDPLQPVLVLLDGQEVAHRLAGVLKVGQGIDHRRRHVLREYLEAAVRGDTGDDAVHPPVEHAGHVGHRLSHAQSDIVPAQVDALAAELSYADLESSPGS